MKRQFYGPYVLGTFDLLEDYVLTHERYVHPEIVLKNENIFIMGCNEDYVWFSVVPAEVGNLLNLFNVSIKNIFN